MRSNRKVRKACKEYIVGMESEAEMVYLSCCHLLSDETIHYRLHTTPEGEVAKVEKENKIKSKVALEGLKPAASKE